MLNSYYTEKLLGLQDVNIKSICEKVNNIEIEVKQKRKEYIVHSAVSVRIRYTITACSW